MARRKSHVTDKEEVKPSSGKLQPPYSSKVDGHRYVIYASFKRDDDEYPRNLVLKFLSTYAARFFVMKLIGDDEYQKLTWFERDDMILTDAGVSIRAHRDQITEILNYEPTPQEAEWRDDQVVQQCLRLRYGASETAKFVDIADDDGKTDDELPKHAPAARAAKSERQKAVREPKAPRPDTTGMVSANELAGKLNVEGRDVRGALRAMKAVKPDHGWSWPKDEAAKIEKEIVAALKRAGKLK